MGRPLTLTFEELKERKFTVTLDEGEQELDWKGALELKGKEGASDAGLYTAIRLTRRVHERLIESSDEYKEFFEYAQDLARSYWLDTMGKRIFNDRNLNSAIYAVQVRNRYGWRQSDDPKPAGAPVEPDKPVEDLVAKHRKKPDNTKTQTTN